MPPDREAYRLGLKAIETIANHLYERDFAALTPHEQDLIMKSLHDGRPAAAEDIWRQLPIHRFWMMLVQDCVEAYYLIHGRGMKSASGDPRTRALYAAGKWLSRNHGSASELAMHGRLRPLPFLTSQPARIRRTSVHPCSGQGLNEACIDRDRR